MCWPQPHLQVIHSISGKLLGVVAVAPHHVFLPQPWFWQRASLHIVALFPVLVGWKEGRISIYIDGRWRWRWRWMPVDARMPERVPGSPSLPLSPIYAPTMLRLSAKAHARLARATRTSIKFVQLACFVHLVNEHIFEIRSVSEWEQREQQCTAHR